MNEILTTDLAKFGSREKAMAGELLIAMSEKGLPEDFSQEHVTIMFNMNSGYVFLTNEESQVAMLTDEGKLESFYTCPICGHEGFLDDMEHNPDDKDCQAYLADIKWTVTK